MKNKTIFFILSSGVLIILIFSSLLLWRDVNLNRLTKVKKLLFKDEHMGRLDVLLLIPKLVYRQEMVNNKMFLPIPCFSNPYCYEDSRKQLINFFKAEL